MADPRRPRADPPPFRATRYTISMPVAPPDDRRDETEDPPRKKGPIKPLEQGALQRMRYVVLLPLPLASGQRLREAIPAGSYPAGPVSTNAPKGRPATATLQGRHLTIQADGATCIVYELRGPDLRVARIGGKVLDAAGRLRRFVANDRGRAPRPPLLDQRGPRFVIASPSANQLVAGQLTQVVVSGTVHDRSGIRDIRAGRGADQMTRPHGEPTPFPGSRAPQVMPFQLLLTLKRGKNELILAAQDAQGNWSAVRVAVYRD